MNKKVSTILTLSLMLGGSLLSSSAFAKNITFPLGDGFDAVSNGSEVVFAQAVNGTDKYVLGFERNDNTIVPKIVKSSGKIDEAKLDNYKWKVLVSKTDVQTTPLYTFVNVATGDTLAFDNTSLWTKGAKDSYAKDQKYSFRWTTAGKEYNEAGYEAGWDILRRFLSEKDFNNGDENGIEFDFANQTVKLVSSPSKSTVLAEVAESDLSDTDLNYLFNSKGFNLTAGEDVEDNLFEGDTRVWAFELTKEYAISAKGANGKKLTIPVGMYFFTDRVLKDDADVENLSADDIDWLASTLIAVMNVRKRPN